MTFRWLLLFLTPVFAATWQYDIVDQSGKVKYTSMKLDAAGNAHVAYVVDDGDEYPLKYGFWDQKLKRWFTMKVATGASFCSLALDSRQQPYISFADYGTASGSKLRYSRWDGSRWQTVGLPLSSDIIGYYTSIVLDDQDRPIISFYEYRGAKDTDFHIRLRNAMWSGTHWQVQTLDPQEGSGKFNAMAIDAKGHIHIAYANVSAGTAGLRYAFFDGNAWKTEVVDGADQNDGRYVGSAVAIALDSESNPHITYLDASSAKVKYAVRNAGQWKIQVVDQLGGVGYPDRNSIAIDEHGNSHVGYYDARRGSLLVAHQTAGKWSTEIVASGGAGFTSSMQIDHGVLWISYSDQGNAGLSVARRQLPDPVLTEQANPVGSTIRQSLK